MKSPLPSTLLFLLSVVPALSHASPQPPLVTSDWEVSLIPRHTLFLRQLSNLQTFEQALGGARASPITNSGNPQRPFSVDGSTFDTFSSAAQRSCDNQFQACQAIANGANGGGGGGGNANGNGNNNNNNNNNKGGNAPNQNQNRNTDNNNPIDTKGKSGKRNPQDGASNKNGLTVQQCEEQRNQCNNTQQAAKVQSFQQGVASTNIGPDPQFPDFDLICEG